VEIGVSQRQGRIPVTIFHLKGDIDANFYEQLQTEAQKAHDTGMHNLILDLSQVKYISSAGLRALHYIFMMLRTNAANESDEAMRKGLSDGTFKSPHLKLVNPSSTVRDALETAGFDMFLEIYPNLEVAVASFQ
jgi:anti-anti-sigma regulatory factor